MFEKPGRKRSNTDIGWDSVSWMRGGLMLLRSVMITRGTDGRKNVDVRKLTI
jgi:hypothetical protein